MTWNAMQRAGASARLALGLAILPLSTSDAQVGYDPARYEGSGGFRGSVMLVNPKLASTAVQLGGDVVLASRRLTWLKPSVGLTYWSSDFDDIGDRRGNAREWAIRANARAQKSGEARLHPFVAAGVGLHFLRADIPDDSALESAIDGTSLGLDLEAGASWRWQSGLDVTARVQRTLVEDVGRWGFGVGLEWTLPNRRPTSLQFTGSRLAEPARRPRVDRENAEIGPVATPVATPIGTSARRIGSSGRVVRLFSELATSYRSIRDERDQYRSEVQRCRSQFGDADTVERDLRRLTGPPDDDQSASYRLADSPQLRFPFNETTLTVGGQESLRRVARTMFRHPLVHVIVSGHTDGTGEPLFNLHFSQRRADAVRDYLVGLGVNADRITAVGMGSSHPLSNDGSRDGRRRNRRVELQFVSPR